MKLIDRYVYAVTEHFQKDLREDIGKELRTNIEDMLPDNYTEKDVYKVLEELGSPFKLANEYNPSKKYLIGPGFYDNYISVLKLVIGICTSVFVGIALLSWAIDPPVDGYTYGNLLVLFTNLIVAVCEGAIQGALWVTVVFVILERSGVESGQIPFSNKKWTPDDLPEYPINDKKKISRKETVFSIFCTVLFTSIIYIKPQLIALFTKDDNGVLNATPFFNIDRLQKYMLIFFVLVIIQLVIFIWKYITGSWNLPLAIVNTIYNIVFSILIIVMFSDGALLNTEFFSKILEITGGTADKISIWMNFSKWIFVAVFVVISCVESISGIVKSLSRTI